VFNTTSLAFAGKYQLHSGRPTLFKNIMVKVTDSDKRSILQLYGSFMTQAQEVSISAQSEKLSTISKHYESPSPIRLGLASSTSFGRKTFDRQTFVQQTFA
jgi:hypothetical protein